MVEQVMLSWTPRKVLDDIKAYDPLVFQWTATHEPRYTTRLNTPGGTVSATAPTSFANCLAFDVPEEADLFGVLISSVRDGTVGTDTVTWTQCKAEVFALGPDDTDASITFGLDTGRAEDVNIWYPSGTTPAGPATAMVAGRQFLDVASGDANVNGVEWMREGAQTATQIMRRIMWFSPFGALSGLPYIGHYKKIYLTLSADPGAGNVTVKYTVTLRPIAIKLNLAGR